MITKELLKAEIDKLPEEHIGAVYHIVRALEGPAEDRRPLDDSEWKTWIAEMYGSTADAPIERGEQGSYESREPLE